MGKTTAARKPSQSLRASSPVERLQSNLPHYEATSFTSLFSQKEGEEGKQDGIIGIVLMYDDDQTEQEQLLGGDIGEDI